MSELLKRIIDAKRLELDTFYEADDGRIIERLKDGTEAPTPYYLDSQGVYMEEEEYIEKLKELEHEKRKEYLAHQEKLRQEAAERKKQEQQQEEQTKKDDTPPNPMVIIIFFGMLLILIACAVYFLWPKDSEDATTKSASENPSEVIEDLPFGDAIITGDEVNFRAAPTTDTLIIGVFPKQGERIRILDKLTDPPVWYRVQREDSTSGWVYGEYVQPTDSLSR